MASPLLLPCHGHDVVPVGKCHTDLKDSPTRDAPEPDGSWFAGSVADRSAEGLFNILVGDGSPSHLISGVLGVRQIHEAALLGLPGFGCRGDDPEVDGFHGVAVKQDGEPVGAVMGEGDAEVEGDDPAVRPSFRQP